MIRDKKTDSEAEFLIKVCVQMRRLRTFKGKTKEGRTSCMITIRQNKIQDNLRIIKFLRQGQKQEKYLKYLKGYLQNWQMRKYPISLRSRVYRTMGTYALFYQRDYRKIIIKKGQKPGLSERIIQSIQAILNELI